MSDPDRIARTKHLTNLLVHLIGHTTCVGYVIATTGQGGVSTHSITCLTCGLTSFNAADIAQKYCGHCELFHDQLLQIQPGLYTVVQSSSIFVDDLGWHRNARP